MQFREANIADIPQLHTIRISVKENMLSDPSLITRKEYEDFLKLRGKGWVCEIDNKIVGFSIVDFQKNNVWALFVHPDFESRGIGRKLLKMLLDGFFAQKRENIWLSTAPDTRAESFYQKIGWKHAGRQPNGESRFELSARDWEKLFPESNRS